MNDDLLTTAEIKKIKGNPLENPVSIMIVKQKDGNWRGFMWKNANLVQVRQGDPTTVLQLLITHP